MRRQEGRSRAVSHRRHRHRFFEIILIESGCGTHRIEDEESAAFPGDVFVIAPGESHDPDGLHGTTHWIIAFEAAFLGTNRTEGELFSGLTDETSLLSFLRPTGNERRKFSLEKLRLEQWLRSLAFASDELATRPRGYAEALHAYLTLLLIDLGRMAAAQFVERAVSNRRPHLQQFFRVLNTTFSEEITLGKLAHRMKLSPAYLTHLIKLETGRSVMQWVNERRIAEAQKLLTSTSDSVKQIAFAVGFKDPSYFVKRFSRVHGASPHAWRTRQ